MRGVSRSPPADTARATPCLSCADPDAPALASFRGIGCCIAGNADYICVGVSTGSVCLVPVPDPSASPIAFGDSLLSPTSDDTIVDVCAGQPPDNDVTRALVCSADAAGQVLVHALEADGMWQNCCTFAASTHDDTPSCARNDTPNPPCAASAVERCKA